MASVLQATQFEAYSAPLITTKKGNSLADKEYLTQAGDGLALGNGFNVYGPLRAHGITVTKFF